MSTTFYFHGKTCDKLLHVFDNKKRRIIEAAKRVVTFNSDNANVLFVNSNVIYVFFGNYYLKIHVNEEDGCFHVNASLILLTQPMVSLSEDYMGVEDVSGVEM